jgi:hypothetical protein
MQSYILRWLDGALFYKIIRKEYVLWSFPLIMIKGVKHASYGMHNPYSPVFHPCFPMSGTKTHNV